ncbi:unnamed protein product [Tuber aestivum]|uniref:Uncharacterized protein n=1 Tax=Tuber aestivum TaxID=59557 RepID=A0A292Q8M4_9PEZI|nr:unnamed protein product [Tuber aestivum]
MKPTEQKPVTKEMDISQATESHHKVKESVRESGIPWLIPHSTQPVDYSFPSPRNKKIADALLTSMGRSELIAAPIPKDITDSEELKPLEKIENLKRAERNKLLYPEKESKVDETLFMTNSKVLYMSLKIQRKYTNH